MNFTHLRIEELPKLLYWHYWMCVFVSCGRQTKCGARFGSIQHPKVWISPKASVKCLLWVQKHWKTLIKVQIPPRLNMGKALQFLYLAAHMGVVKVPVNLVTFSPVWMIRYQFTAGLTGVAFGLSLGWDLNSHLESILGDLTPQLPCPFGNYKLCETSALF